MESLMELAARPETWAALAALIAMEVVLGIDNLVFIAILSNKLPEHQREKARRVGILGALVLRLALLATVAWIIGLTRPIVSIFGTDLSWRDIILLAGGLFLIWKATKEIHHNVDPVHSDDMFEKPGKTPSFTAAVAQILILDLVFSIDSIITAVGMTPHLAIMVVAVVTTVLVMLVAATPLANFVGRNPTVVMLALSFLLLIGATLVAEAFGVEFPKGYVYFAMAFSAGVEGLNIWARNSQRRKSIEDKDQSG